jgi:hypothetical protein
MITGLILFVLHHYGDLTKKWFSSHALDGSLSSKWDEKTGAVIMPNNKVVQDGLSSKLWWLQDTLQGVEDHTTAKPTQPVGHDFNAAGCHINMDSQVTFAENMETTRMYDPKDNPNDNHSSSSSSKASSNLTSDEDSSDNKVQTKGSSMSCNSNAVKKLLQQSPKMLQQILAKVSKKKAKPKTKKNPAKITPPKPKKSGTLTRGSGKDS